MVYATVSRTSGTKLAPNELEKIEGLVKAGSYLNTSDFIREAVREKLESIEVILLRDVDYKTAKKEVLGYYEKYREAYPHEVANNLELDVELVHRITKELIKEKRLGVMK
jgi:Arc/MetJ-type ribon-helix-helix transcriptional regulator